MFGLCAINVEKTEHRNMQSGSLAQGIYTAFRKTSQFVFWHNSYRKLTNFNKNFSQYSGDCTFYKSKNNLSIC